MKRVLLAGCVAVAGVLSQSAVASDGKVKIGVLTDLSGPAQDIGKGSVVAAQIAIEEFGGKVLGKEIEFISGDTSNKPDVASAVARQWIDIEKVDVLVDLGLTHTALAVLPIAADKNKIAIAVSPAGTNITNEACTATSIHWMYDTYALAAGTSRVLVDKGMKNWFFITTDYAFGHALEKDARDYITSAGGNVVGTVRHPFNASDMSSFVLTAQGSKANVIALANSNNDTVNAVKQAQEYGVTPTQYVAPLVMYLSTVHGMGLDLAQGLYLTEGFYWNQDERARGFAEKFKGRMPTMIQAGFYSATLAYLNAVKAAATIESRLSLVVRAVARDRAGAAGRASPTACDSGRGAICPILRCSILGSIDRGAAS